MAAPDLDHLFAGSIPQLYQRHLVPLIFEPYADELAARVAAAAPSAVLEIAAGTGALTRRLVARLAGTAIVATDLNRAMLDEATAITTGAAVLWGQANALRLPFPDASFDVIACQFGVMFFPDQRAAFAEARRVLRPGGRFVFNVWDDIEHNEFADVVTRALANLFPHDPPRFLARTPHGHGDARAMAEQLLAAGFARVAALDTLAARSRASAAEIPAIAYCQGTPLRNEIEARDAARLLDATRHATAAIAARFGSRDHGAVDGKIQAHIFVAER